MTQDKHTRRHRFDPINDSYTQRVKMLQSLGQSLRLDKHQPVPEQFDDETQSPLSQDKRPTKKKFDIPHDLQTINTLPMSDQNDQPNLLKRLDEKMRQHTSAGNRVKMVDLPDSIIVINDTQNLESLNKSQIIKNESTPRAK